MYTNESSQINDFLIPSSIPGILPSNRQTHTAFTQRSSCNKTIHKSPNKKQNDSQYTFEPRINSSHKKRRSLEKFMEDQEKYQHQKERKLTEMKEEITKWEDEEVRKVPQVNQKMKTFSSQQSEDVFDRLSKEKSLKEIPSCNFNFSPHILPKSKDLFRGKAATELLYEDAKRRENQQKVIRESEEKKIIAMSMPKINANTNDLVRKKILAQFMQLISDETMNPLLALSILEELFNVKLREIGSPFVRRLVQLIADEKGEVRAEKLWSFVAVIIGNSQGFFPEDQQIEIKVNYGYFYKERINKERKQAIPDLPTFVPRTSVNAEQLAGRHRQKLCKKASEFVQTQNIPLVIENDTIALEDLFIIEHMHRQKQNQKLKLEKENQEAQNCTFKPTIHKNCNKHKQKIVLKYPLKQKEKNILRTSNQPTERNLLEPSKVRSVERTQPPTERISLSKEKKADIVQRNRKSLDNISARMLMARVERQFQTKMAMRSYDKDVSWTKDCKKKHQQLIDCSKRVKGFLQQ